MCAPTAAACDSLSRSLENCLRTLRPIVNGSRTPSPTDEADTTSSASSFYSESSFPLLACGGFFELYLRRILQELAEFTLCLSHQDAQNQPDQVYERGKFATEHLTPSELSSNVHRTCNEPPVSNPPPPNHHSSPSDLSLDEGIQILSEALLVIPQTIHRNSISTGKDHRRFIHSLHLAERVIAGQGSTPEVVYFDAVTGTPVRVVGKMASVAAESADLAKLNSEASAAEGDVQSAPDAPSSVIPDCVNFDDCDVESFEGKMAVVEAVLDLAIVVLNIERVVPAKCRLTPSRGQSAAESDEEE